MSSALTAFETGHPTSRSTTAQDGMGGPDSHTTSTTSTTRDEHGVTYQSLELSQIGSWAPEIPHQCRRYTVPRGGRETLYGSLGNNNFLGTFHRFHLSIWNETYAYMLDGRISHSPASQHYARTRRSDPRYTVGSSSVLQLAPQSVHESNTGSNSYYSYAPPSVTTNTTMSTQPSVPAIAGQNVIADVSMQTPRTTVHWMAPLTPRSPQLNLGTLLPQGDSDEEGRGQILQEYLAFPTNTYDAVVAQGAASHATSDGTRLSPERFSSEPNLHGLASMNGFDQYEPEGY